MQHAGAERATRAMMIDALKLSGIDVSEDERNTIVPGAMERGPRARQRLLGVRWGEAGRWPAKWGQRNPRWMSRPDGMQFDSSPGIALSPIGAFGAAPANPTCQLC